MIWIALALYLLGMVTMSGWFYETENIYLFTQRWLALMAVWPVVAFVIGLSALLDLIHTLQTRRGPHA